MNNRAIIIYFVVYLLLLFFIFYSRDNALIITFINFSFIFIESIELDNNQLIIY